MVKRKFNPNSNNLPDRSAPDRPGTTVHVTIKFTEEQKAWLDEQQESRSYHARQALANYIEYPDRQQFVKEAIATFLNLSGQTIAKLDATGDRAKAIEVAIALLEENGLMEELAKRVKT